MLAAEGLQKNKENPCDEDIAELKKSFKKN
jgi:hypothetical protein